MLATGHLVALCAEKIPCCAAKYGKERKRRKHVYKDDWQDTSLPNVDSFIDGRGEKWLFIFNSRQCLFFLSFFLESQQYICKSNSVNPGGALPRCWSVVACPGILRGFITFFVMFSWNIRNILESTELVERMLCLCWEVFCFFPHDYHILWSMHFFSRVRTG